MERNVNEFDRYNKNSGYGENRTLEMDVIKHYFGDKLLSMEPVDDKERQVSGIDYVVKVNNGTEIRELNIDTKIHHYDSELFVFEYDDTRKNYNNRTWGGSDKKTDVLIWIIPAKNKYCVYSENSLKEFRNSMKWWFYNHENFMDVNHKDKYGNFTGKTINKWLPLNFTIGIGKRYFTRQMDMSGYKCWIKESYFYWNEMVGQFRRKIM